MCDKMLRDALLVCLFGVAAWYMCIYTSNERGSELVQSFNATYDYIVGKFI